MKGLASILVVSVCAHAFSAPADAQVRLRPAPDSTIPTLGGAPSESAAPDEAFREFLREAHPLWSSLRWERALPNLEVLAISGFPADVSGISRVAPDFTATGISLALDFKNSELTARRAYLLDDYLILRDMALRNDSGQMEAEFAILSQDALTLIGDYLGERKPEDADLAIAGEILLNNAIAVSHEFAGDRPGRGFASTISADLIAFSGLTWGEGDDPAPIFSGLKGIGLSGSARFGGTAEFSLARFEFSGSVPDIRRVFLERLGRNGAGLPQPASLTAPTATEGAEEIAADADSGSGGDTEFTLPAPIPAPVAHPFSLAFSDLAYSATRGSDAPATISAHGGMLRGAIEENGAIEVRARLAEMHASASLFAGTPLEESTQQMAERAGQPHLSLDIALDAALTSDRLRLNIPCAMLPGLIDIGTDIDVTIPGLEQMLSASPGGRSNGAMDLLFASQARALSVRLVDNGLNAVLRTAGLAPLGELIEDTLLSRLEGQEGMRMMMLQTALAPVTSILSQFDEQGSVALEARFDNETNLPVALVSFLQSAQPVENTAPDTARCESIPLVQ